jgi:hypothetical protein
MNAEAWKEISDAVSFALVTPEFLGEERLKSFRSSLVIVVKRIAETLFVDENTLKKRSYLFVRISAFAVPQAALLLYWHQHHAGQPMTFVPKGLAFLAGFFLLFLPTSLSVILILLHRVASRGILFL